MDIENDTPVSDSPTETFEASVQLADIALQRVLFHFFDRSIYAGKIARWNALKTLSRGRGEGDEPRLLLFGVRRE